MASNAEFTATFGSDVELWSPSTGERAKPADILSNKVVLLYFSAQWCGPCGRFTPVLKTLYNTLKHAAKEDFEVVFCSLDKVQAGYDNYCKDMPWWCLPFKSPLMGKLANLYCDGELSIPLLVVIDKDGAVIVPDGVGEVTLDETGSNFPWRPKPVVELLPADYIDQQKVHHSMQELDDKYLMLYFSAHWCPPCKAFTPKLSKAYTALKNARSDFELLYVSSDRDQETFESYFASMTFPALPFSERQAKADLSSRLQVKGIPTLMMFGPRPADGSDRALINANLRNTIEQGDYLSDFPFQPKLYGDLNQTTDNINNLRCVIVFHECGDDEEQENIQEVLKIASENCEDKRLRFFWAYQPTGLSKSVREAVNLGSPKDEPVMVLLDIPDQGAYFVSDQQTDLSPDSILAFINKPGERRQI